MIARRDEVDGDRTRLPRLALIGQLRWSQVLARGLEGGPFDISVVGIDRASDAIRLDHIRELHAADLILRVGFRSGALTVRGLLLDMFVELFKRTSTTEVMYWIGTDVSAHASEAGGARRPARWRMGQRLITTHLAGSTPLRDELRELDIPAEVADFPAFFAHPQGPLPPIPEDFAVLTYIPDARADFYGGNVVLALALRFPAVSFVVMGGWGGWLSPSTRPPNLHFVGWVADARPLYSECSVVLRLVRHDSIGATVAEGLLFGRPVLYTRPFPYSTLVAFDTDDVGSKLERLVELHTAGELRTNGEAARWASERFDSATRFAALAERLSSAFEGRSDDHWRRRLGGVM